MDACHREGRVLGGFGVESLAGLEGEYLIKQNINEMSYFRPRYKCCFIGPYGAGKTSFIRSVLGMSLDRVQTTLGIDFFTTSLSIHNTTAHITLWDTAGAERYRSLMHSYVRDSDIVFVMYDITDLNAMASVEHCFRDLESCKPSVVAVVGTKTDLGRLTHCLLYTSPSPRDLSTSRMPSSA